MVILPKNKDEGELIKMIKEINSVVEDKNNFWNEETIVCELEKSRNRFIGFHCARKIAKNLYQ